VRSRLRLGWAAKGDSGYYGYACHVLSSAVLDAGFHLDAADQRERDIETVEAELVILFADSARFRAPFGNDVTPRSDLMSPTIAR
jgi:hypothetical protein